MESPPWKRHCLEPTSFRVDSAAVSSFPSAQKEMAVSSEMHKFSPRIGAAKRPLADTLDEIITKKQSLDVMQSHNLVFTNTFDESIHVKYSARNSEGKERNASSINPQGSSGDDTRLTKYPLTTYTPSEPDLSQRFNLTLLGGAESLTQSIHRPLQSIGREFPIIPYNNTVSCEDGKEMVRQHEIRNPHNVNLHSHFLERPEADTFNFPCSSVATSPTIPNISIVGFHDNPYTMIDPNNIEELDDDMDVNMEC